MTDPTNTHRYVHMPKTGGTTVTASLLRAGWTGAQGHTPARLQPRGLRLFATLRDPREWYCSWYAHCWRACEHGRNERTEHALRAYGRGSMAWPDVLEGLLHPDLVEIPHVGDPLFAPSGRRVEGGLYSLHVVHWLMVGGKWGVDEIVPTRTITAWLASHGLPEVRPRRVSARRPEWPAGCPVRRLDDELWASARGLVDG